MLAIQNFSCCSSAVFGCPGNYFKGGKIHQCWGSPRREGLPGVQLGSQSPFESQNPNFTCKILLICQGSIKAQRKRRGKQMCKMLLHYVVRCFRGDGAGEVPAVPYVLFWPQIKTNRCRSVNWKGRASRSAPSFEMAVRAGPFALQIAPRPLKTNSRIIFFLAGGDLQHFPSLHFPN